MKPDVPIEHEFIDFVPKVREENKIYVSIKYATAVHNCFCGCGTKVVTPLSPTGWQLTFDGDTISLTPSIGNWSFACRSHYWVKRDRVVWAGDMADEDIEAGRARDRAARDEYFASAPKPAPKKETTASKGAGGKKRNVWDWLLGR